MTDTNASQDQYRQIISDMLGELNQVLDEHVVTRVARNVEGLELSETGEITSLNGDPQEIVQNLIDKFVGLSNTVVVKTLQPLLKQHPWIKVPDIRTE